MTKEYKNEYTPDFVSPPGDTLSEMLSERGMSQADLAERMERPLKTINEIIKGKAAITSDTAIQLERVFGVEADFWNQLELSYRSFLAKLKEDQRLSGHDDWLLKYKFPISQMIKRGWIPDIGKNKLLQIRELLNFYSVASNTAWEKIWLKRDLAFRRSDKVDTKSGPTSAWIRQGEIEASKIKCKDFDIDILKSSISKLRALTLEPNPDIFVPELISICSDAGVAVVFLPTFEGAPVSGVSQWLNPKKAMVLLSLRYKTDDHLWFTFFHELAHIILHKKKGMFVEFTKQDNEKPIEETEADEFASETLIPKNILIKWLGENKVIERTIISFAKNIGISPGIVVGRLHHMGILKHSQLNNLRQSYKWSQEA